MKKMILIAICAILASNVFAAGGLKDKFGKKQSQQEQQGNSYEESTSEVSGFKQNANLMETLKAMKPGDYWVHVVDYGSGNSKTNVLTIKLLYQMYTRVGGGFIVQTYSMGSAKEDRPITSLSSLFVTDKEMFGN